MVSCGMPELQNDRAVLFLRDKLCVDMTAEKAEKYFMSEIQKSLDTTWRRFDDFIHDNKQ